MNTPQVGREYQHCDSGEVRHVVRLDTEQTERMEPTFTVGYLEVRDGSVCGYTKYESGDCWQKWACEAKLLDG